MREVPDASVDLERGIAAGFSLPLAGFQTLFDAMLGGASVLFSGEVEVELGEGTGERIGFLGRFDQLGAEGLRSTEVYVPETGIVQTTLRNCIESPLEIRTLPSALERGGAQVEGRLSGLDLGAPVVLPPGGEISFAVQPVATLEGEGPADAIFDLSGVKVMPDREALLAAIIDPDTPATYDRVVTVRALEALFQPTAEKPDDAIGAVMVEFEGGEAAELNPAQLTASASLHVPILDFLQSKVDALNYRYKVRVIRPSGQTLDENWRTGNAESFFPEVRR
jgi:hypothetical protein